MNGPRDSSSRVVRIGNQFAGTGMADTYGAAIVPLWIASSQTWAQVWQECSSSAKDAHLSGVTLGVRSIGLTGPRSCSSGMMGVDGSFIHSDSALARVHPRGCECRRGHLPVSIVRIATRAEPRCGNCGYNLTGSESNRCSECGLQFTEGRCFASAEETTTSGEFPFFLLATPCGCSGLGHC